MHKEFCWVQLNKPENIRCPGVLHYSVFSAWDSGLNSFGISYRLKKKMQFVPLELILALQLEVLD